MVVPHLNKTFPDFIELGSSLPCSEKRVIKLCHKPYESSSHPDLPLFHGLIHFNSILLLNLSLRNSLFPLDFTTVISYLAERKDLNFCYYSIGKLRVLHTY
jgi:hypothetical protein